MLNKTNYVVRVDSCPEWKQYTDATLAMCMGNDNWEKEKFLTVLEWASRHFTIIRVALSDSLGRHNLMMSGVSSERSEIQARMEGNLWLEEHEEDLRKCGKEAFVVRWDHWREKPCFLAVLDDFTRLSQTNELFAEAIAKDVETYRYRYLRRGISVGSNFEEHCRNYLFEELAGTTLRARAMSNSCRVYPAPEPASSKLVRAGLIGGAPIGLEKEYYAAINIRRRKGGSPFARTENELGDTHTAS